jgi:hypothetical protein
MFPEVEEIQTAVQKLIPGFRGKQIIVSSTHTHAGADVVGLWGPERTRTGVNAAYLERIKQSAVKAIQAAWQRRRPATAYYAVGEAGEGWVHNISEPEEVDRSLTVLRFLDAGKNNIATLVNFACHPTVLDDFATAASADYVGGYYRYTDSVQGGINLFLQGAIGGWVQPEGILSSYENAMRYGRLLGDAVHKLTKTEKKISGSSIIFRDKTLHFPVDNAGFRALASAGVIQRKFEETVRTSIVYFKIGNAAFVTHPGETAPALSFFSKQRMKTDGPKFVLGLGQDALGYIVKPSFFEPGNKIPHSQYLAGMSLGASTYPLLQAAIEAILKE